MLASARIAAAIPACAGIGLRFPHHGRVLERQPSVGWLEIHTENYLGGGAHLQVLEQLRAAYPVSLHCVGLSLGSARGVDATHLGRIAELAGRIDPGLVSDHLSWGAVDADFVPDLLPLPLTDESLDVVCRNVDHVQSVLRRRILVENPSKYLKFRDSTIPEWAFLAELSKRSGCGILFDVNNLAVSAGGDPEFVQTYLVGLPAGVIGEMHLAGHGRRVLTNGVEVLVDDHGSAITDAVWDLYETALARFGRVPTLIEWDTNIPEMEVLVAQAAKAQAYLSARAAQEIDALVA